MRYTEYIKKYNIYNTKLRINTGNFSDLENFNSARQARYSIAIGCYPYFHQSCNNLMLSIMNEKVMKSQLTQGQGYDFFPKIHCNLEFVV